MDTNDEIQILQALREMSRSKVEAEAEASGAAQVLSSRKSWLDYKRRNAAAWSAQMTAEYGAHTMKLGSAIRF